MSIDKVFFIFEIIGTVAFAITGVITAIEKNSISSARWCSAR